MRNFLLRVGVKANFSDTKDRRRNERRQNKFFKRNETADWKTRF
jgi:hypothetical protein